MKKLHIFFICISLSLAGCSTDPVEMPIEVDYSVKLNNAETNEKNVFTTFKVTIENIGHDEPLLTLLSPGVFVVQKQKSEPLFSVGVEDYGLGLENIAEDGNPNFLYENLDHHPKIREYGIFATPIGAMSPSPITPGGKYEFYITAKPKDYLNFVTMYAQSNDVFIAPNSQGISLFDNWRNPIEGDITNSLYYWDAGTEVNQEPGLGEYQAPRQSAPNTGMDENGVVHFLDDGFYYPSLETIIRVTIVSM